MTAEHILTMMYFRDAGCGILCNVGGGTHTVKPASLHGGQETPPCVNRCLGRGEKMVILRACIVHAAMHHPGKHEMPVGD
jgi:hypothetical protein